jgi:hypothetical protein
MKNSIFFAFAFTVIISMSCNKADDTASNETYHPKILTVTNGVPSANLKYDSQFNSFYPNKEIRLLSTSTDPENAIKIYGWVYDGDTLITKDYSIIFPIHGEYNLIHYVVDEIGQASSVNIQIIIKKNTATYYTRYLEIDINTVAKFAPQLHFHPSEGNQCCYPSSAEIAYPRAKIGQTGEHRIPKNLEHYAPCYYEAFGSEDAFRIKYWFWYNYNDFPQGPDHLIFFDLPGSHPGDWEYIQIFFLNGTPYQYNFSNHKGARMKKPHEVSVVNNLLQVWVGNGSHANYESPNPTNIASYYGFSDEVKDGGSVWYTGNNLVFVLNTNFGIDNYLGDWGDGEKIFGPLNKTEY